MVTKTTLFLCRQRPGLPSFAPGSAETPRNHRAEPPNPKVRSAHPNTSGPHLINLATRSRRRSSGRVLASLHGRCSHLHPRARRSAHKQQWQLIAYRCVLLRGDRLTPDRSSYQSNLSITRSYCATDYPRLRCGPRPNASLLPHSRHQPWSTA